MDKTNPSNSQSQSQSQSNWVPISQTATCKKCGCANLAWQHGRSGGKWYLCATRRNQDGKLEADRRGFHKCQPSYTNAHRGTSQRCRPPILIVHCSSTSGLLLA